MDKTDRNSAEDFCHPPGAVCNAFSYMSRGWQNSREHKRPIFVDKKGEFLWTFLREFSWTCLVNFFNSNDYYQAITSPNPNLT